MSLIYLTTNKLTGATMSSSSEHSEFVVENIINGQPFFPFEFNAAANDDQVTADPGGNITVDFVSIHGHNVDSGVTAIQLRKSSDNFSSNDVLVATLTKADPSFYATFTETTERYWRLLFDGTNGEAIWIGEWILGSRATLAKDQLMDWSVDVLQPQSRLSGTLVPQVFAANMTTYRQRMLSLQFVAESIAQRDVIEDLYVNTRFGMDPIVVVPDDTEETVIHGRLTNQLQWQRQWNSLHRTSVRVEEDPFPLATP